ncbi:speckle-type POZ protein-like [Daphnia pulicaria]|uniref:speckle-type POZ protein-like n=1 Tax=Daphnia pulicaria TaxID=35523 RepID=UPI001EEA76D9|nr:speckle-type POZ protein-like [Daphnia pulicaria]
MITEFTEMFNSQHRCDVHFQFNNGKTIGAHILILSARNPVFASMFQSGMFESQTRKLIIIITDIDEEVFRQLLIHLYSGIAPKIQEKNITQPLYIAADKYDIETLKSECIDVLLKKLGVTNAIELFIWSHLHFVPKIFESAMKCLVQNRREICLLPKWLDFVKSHPELSVLVTQRMVNLV